MRTFEQLPALIQLRKGPCVAKAEVQSLNRWVDGKLPPDYEQFLLSIGEIEGYPNDVDFLCLWGPANVMRFNQAYKVQQYAIGLLIIGSNGCGEAIAYDLLGKNTPVVHVPFVGLGRERILYQADDLAGYLRKLYGPKPTKSTRGEEIELVEIKPILFGGDPVEPKNKVFLDRAKHIEFVNFWNAKLQDLHRLA